MSQHTILDFYSRSHTAYLHACGEKATTLLIEKVGKNPGEKILEIGFGTGATLVRMAQKFTGAMLYGVDISDHMLKKARSRLRLCGLQQRCQLSVLPPGSPLPFPDAFFDTVYAESVLGILEGAHFGRMFEEIHRVMKPGGQLVFNETIWLESTTPEEIHRINTACKSAFGIIQANGDFPYPQNWMSLLKEKGFSISEIFRLDQVDLPSNPDSDSFRSRVFTFSGKLKAILIYRSFFKNMKKAGAQITGQQQQMAGFMVVAEKLTASPVLHQ